MGRPLVARGRVEILQGNSDALHRGSPGAGPVLMEDAQVREPVPEGSAAKGREGPDRQAEAAGQMDRGVGDRDHQIEGGELRGKPFHIMGGVDLRVAMDRDTGFSPGGKIGFSVSVLHADQRCTGGRRDRLPLRQLQRLPGATGGAVAVPGDPD